LLIRRLQDRDVRADHEYSLVRALARGRLVVVVTGVLGQPVVGAGLVGHVAAAGGAVAALVRVIAGDGDAGGAVDGRAKAGAVVAGGEEIEADRAAAVGGGPAQRAHVAQLVADRARRLARDGRESGLLQADVQHLADAVRVVVQTGAGKERLPVEGA